MATNPFYIEPLGGADLGGTLVGLGGLMQRRKEMDARAAHREEEDARRVAQEQQTAQAKKAVLQAYRSGDPNQIAEAMATYPEMQKELTAAIGFKNEATKNNMLVSARKILQNPDKAEDFIRSRIAFVDSNDGDSSHMKAELKNLKEDREGFLKGTREIYAGLAPKQEWEAYAQRAGIGPKAQGLASAKTEILDDGTAIQALPSGEVVVRNPAGEVVAGQERINALRQARQAGLTTQERESDIAVKRARRVAAATGREQRIRERRKEFADKSTEASRGQRKVQQALQAASKATQGIAGTAKMQLARLFPGIDVTNEAQLDQASLDLALSELQRIKGPTTDFELEKMQEITGQVGDPKTANIARLKGLQRNNWFIRRQADAFKDYIKGGGDPDDFTGLDLNERIAIKGGQKDISLADLSKTAIANNMTIEETLKALNK